jgi:aminopeptidase N
MEYSGLVVVEDGLYARGGGVEWLTAHEVAHQWWYVVVGNDPVAEPWLDEALTQYSTMLYYERTYGAERGASIVRSVFRDTYEQLLASGRDKPVGLAASAYSPGQYFQVVYDKGALYFDDLRKAVGDERFFEILRLYYERHRYGIATPDSYLDVVESVTGDRHLDVYEKWIGPPGQ